MPNAKCERRGLDHAEYVTCYWRYWGGRRACGPRTRRGGQQAASKRQQKKQRQKRDSKAETRHEHKPTEAARRSHQTKGQAETRQRGAWASKGRDPNGAQQGDELTRQQGSKNGSSLGWNPARQVPQEPRSSQPALFPPGGGTATRSSRTQSPFHTLCPDIPGGHSSSCLHQGIGIPKIQQFAIDFSSCRMLPFYVFRPIRKSFCSQNRPITTVFLQACRDKFASP